MEIRSVMMAGVELVLSRCFHTAALAAPSKKQSSLKFVANLCNDRNFQTKTSSVTAAWHEHRCNEY